MGKKSMVDVRNKGKISYRGYGSNIIPVSTDNPISSNYTLVKTTNPRKYKIPYVDRNGKIYNFMEKVSKPKRRLEFRGSYEVPINTSIPVDATTIVRPDTTEIEYPNFIFGIDNNNYGLFTTGISSDINGNLMDYNNNGRPISQEEAIDRIKGYVKSPSERRAEAIEKAFPNREKRKEGGTNKRIFLGDVPGITNVDTRSDSTRQGYHEGTIPYGAGSGLNVLGPVGLAIKGIDELDRQTNMTREDSPIYHPGLITGEAPSTGLGKIAKTKGMIRSMKDAVKASGKSYSPALRGNNKTYNYNAITANDVFNESKVVSGAGVYAKPKPKFTPKTKGNSEWWTDLDEGNSFIKANKLTPFKASNGKDYVKLPDGSIKSVEGIGKRIRAKDEDFINYLRSL